ncbi:hypothetical protein DNC80_10275 [Flavobacterium sp. SOK18b]|uniref:restriction endonuclease subunit S n=1 Tax=Flavobacterium sp. SOK18b TaxID=797900 RepID=UPI0015FC843F|nr:restriction endonuclease subunit S [Flavobacterium sp. SOK18b]MBB1194048.1 hypothetical protein [Flavobacterium sp. SOK18b]
MSQNKLPKDWKWVKLGDIVTLSTQKHAPVKPEDIFYIGLEHIEKHTGKLTSKVGLEKIITIKNKFSKGDILYGKLRPNLNKVYLSKEEGVCSTDILVLKLSEECIGKYLHPIMFSTTFVNKMSDNTSGVNLPRVSTKFILNYEIPLPPLETQRAIISKIEELFSELDKGIEDLKTAQLQLKTYRQSVLKWAFEGKLTNEKVKDGVLPKGWENVSLKEVCEVKRGKSKNRPRNAPELYGGNYPFIQTGDIRNANGGYIKKYSQTYSEIGLAQSKLWPKGTLCITIAANIGETAILNFDACFPDSVVGLLSKKNILFNKYLNYFFISFKQKLEELAPATAQKNINVDILEKVNIPLAPFEEQHQIVQEIESRLSVADKMEESITQSLQQAEALRQSILKKAFDGKLV